MNYLRAVIHHRHESHQCLTLLCLLPRFSIIPSFSKVLFQKPNSQYYVHSRTGFDSSQVQESTANDWQTRLEVSAHILAFECLRYLLADSLNGLRKRKSKYLIAFYSCQDYYFCSHDIQQHIDIGFYTRRREYFDEQHKYTTLFNWPSFLLILGEVERGDYGGLEMYFVWWK